MVIIAWTEADCTCVPTCPCQSRPRARGSRGRCTRRAV